MTTTRIDHTGHAHANTTAARTACRNAMSKNPVADKIAATRTARRAALDAVLSPAPTRPMYAAKVWDSLTGQMVTEMRPVPTWIKDAHCQACGNVVDRDCGAWDGYTSCCNERVVGADGRPCTGDDCYHN